VKRDAQETKEVDFSANHFFVVINNMCGLFTSMVYAADIMDFWPLAMILRW